MRLSAREGRPVARIRCLPFFMPLAAWGRATQDFESGCSGGGGDFGHLLMASLGLLASTDFKVLSPSRDNLTGKIGENAVCVPLHGNGIALRVTYIIDFEQARFARNFTDAEARRHDMIFHYREGRASRSVVKRGPPGCSAKFFINLHLAGRIYRPLGLKIFLDIFALCPFLDSLILRCKNQTRSGAQ